MVESARMIGVKGGKLTRLVLCWAYYRVLYIDDDIETTAELAKEGVGDLCGADLSWELFSQLLGYGCLTKEQALDHAVSLRIVTVVLMLMKGKEKPNNIETVYLKACSSKQPNVCIIELARHVPCNLDSGIATLWKNRHYDFAKGLIEIFELRGERLKAVVLEAVKENHTINPDHQMLLTWCATHIGIEGIDDQHFTHEALCAVIKNLMTKQTGK
jgi:hypothetical protein